MFCVKYVSRLRTTVCSTACACWGNKTKLSTPFLSSHQTGFRLGIAVAAHSAIIKDRGLGNTFSLLCPSMYPIFSYLLSALKQLPKCLTLSNLNYLLLIELTFGYGFPVSPSHLLADILLALCWVAMRDDPTDELSRW